LVEGYNAGASVRQLVDRFELHRTTVLAHLERAGVARRPHTRKLTDVQIAAAAELYDAGWSLARLGTRFDVDSQTVRRTLRSQGVQMRPRRGWSPTPAEDGQ
jgi:lambda repressor-like predicted transcriptional regulator